MPGEQPGLATLMDLQDRAGDREQLLGIGLEEVIARVRFAELQQVLPAVTGGRESGEFEQLVHPASQDRDLRDRLVVRAGREQPYEPVLADHDSLGIETLDAYIVQWHGTVHRRPGVRLRENQNPRFGGVSAHSRRHLGERLRLHPVRPQKAQTRARLTHQCHRVGVAHQVVGPVAEEREVTFAEPLQELRGLLAVLGGHGHRRRGT